MKSNELALWSGKWTNLLHVKDFVLHLFEGALRLGLFESSLDQLSLQLQEGLFRVARVPLLQAQREKAQGYMRDFHFRNAEHTVAWRYNNNQHNHIHYRIQLQEKHRSGPETLIPCALNCRKDQYFTPIPE